MCSVARILPAGRTSEGFILITKTACNAPTLIFVVEMTPSGTVKGLCGQCLEGCTLSRVSDSLFCISYEKLLYRTPHCGPPRLPVVTVTLRARDQFLALATSTHPRCGAKSPPSRVLTPSLLRVLWDFCVAAAERRLVVPMGTSDAYDSLVHYAGVSPLLLSVTPRGVSYGLEEDRPSGRGWADADRHVVFPRGDEGFVLRDVSSSRGRGVDVLRLEYEPGWCYSINRRWWCGIDESRGLLCVQSLVVPSSSSSSQQGREQVQMQMQAGGLPTPRSVVVTVAVNPESVEFLGMGKSNPDELLVVLRPSLVELGTHEKRLLVVDAQQTFSSGNLYVACSVARSLPAGKIRDGFILITKTGLQVCVIQIWAHVPAVRAPSHVFVVDMSPSGTVKGLSGDCWELSRLSDSLFCISYQRLRYELWDCNDTEKPMRVVHTTAFVVGECGFLVQITASEGQNRKMSVVDARSGFVIFTLSCSPSWLPYMQQHFFFVD
ncbi:hypothetical protein Pelo_374 [Pelomyxa schiedti]|nr:hypothetical protein Pelo_374 [Pelomyxa schiedti]